MNLAGAWWFCVNFGKLIALRLKKTCPPIFLALQMPMWPPSWRKGLLGAKEKKERRQEGRIAATVRPTAFLWGGWRHWLSIAYFSLAALPRAFQVLKAEHAGQVTGVNNLMGLSPGQTVDSLWWKTLKILKSYGAVKQRRSGATCF